MMMMFSNSSSSKTISSTACVNSTSSFYPSSSGSPLSGCSTSSRDRWHAKNANTESYSTFPESRYLNTYDYPSSLQSELAASVPTKTEVTIQATDAIVCSPILTRDVRTSPAFTKLQRVFNDTKPKPAKIPTHWEEQPAPSLFSSVLAYFTPKPKEAEYVRTIFADYQQEED